jgi:hypothetical protein
MCYLTVPYAFLHSGYYVICLSLILIVVETLCYKPEGRGFETRKQKNNVSGEYIIYYILQMLDILGALPKD